MDVKRVAARQGGRVATGAGRPGARRTVRDPYRLGNRLCVALLLLSAGVLLPRFAASQGVSGSGVSAQGAAPVHPPTTHKPEATGEKVMSPQQARALLASVDTIMKFASNDSGLPPVDTVKRRLVSREEVRRYLVRSFDEDESAKRLQRSEIVLKKFGMLPRDFDLRPFLLSLLTEQIAGYYDDKTKTVNLLNWVDPEEQKPVLAHELTHALQDGRVGLEHWSSNGFKGVSRAAGEDNDRALNDEVETARQAVAEGQAMAVFINYTLRDTGKTLVDAPEAGQRVRDASADASGSPLMARAPLLLQRSLMFPYADGLGFEQALLAAGGRQVAFAGALAAPPSTSYEVMNPEAYLRHEAMPAVRLPDVHPLLDAEYAPYDVGAMGALDVEIMATLFGGPQVATALTPAWAGGVYYAGQRRADLHAGRAGTGSLAVFYLSDWRSEEAAAAFEKIYRAELGRKYARLEERNADEAPRELVFTTDEGDVLLARTGKQLFIAEGFALPVARTLRDRVAAVQPTGPVQMASAAGGAHLPELTSKLRLTLLRLGSAAVRPGAGYTLADGAAALQKHVD